MENNTDRKKVILVVDDQENITKFLCRAIQQRFKTVETVGLYDGYDALNWLGDNTPDIVITDLRLPRYGGLEIIMNTISRAPRTPIFVMSAAALLEEIQQMMGGLDCIRFYAKPFLVEKMLADLEDLLIGDPDSVIQGISQISLLQVIKLEDKTCRLDFEQDGVSGRMYFLLGELMRAEVGDLQGPEAFFHMMAFRKPKINVYDNTKTRTTNVHETIENLLIEHCRRLDQPEDTPAA
ncbi:MAG: response regulator [Methylacidiphilales bacterium]|nr:response regulator [Candidatus Methylacidiphilales bacterium]